MKTMFQSKMRRPAEKSQKTPMRITRHFVETGDPRCPIAGLWVRLSEVDAQPEDAELPWPAMMFAPAWRAFAAA